MSDEQVQRRVGTMRARVDQLLGDIDYYRKSPLDWRHGTVIVWAGMRGVVTLAAAQTLPREGIEHRALLVLIAFLVALVSLMLQGFTLPAVVRALGLSEPGEQHEPTQERESLDGQLRKAAASSIREGTLVRRDGTAFAPELFEAVAAQMDAPPEALREAEPREIIELRMASIGAMRRRLDELSHGGAYSTEALRHALAQLDADELSLQMRLNEE